MQLLQYSRETTRDLVRECVQVCKLHWKASLEVHPHLVWMGWSSARNVVEVFVQCHDFNLDDCLEWYLFTSLHGNGRLIPYRRGNVIRPFLTTPKSSFVRWCEKNSVEYLTDPGNYDEKFMDCYW